MTKVITTFAVSWNTAKAKIIKKTDIAFENNIPNKPKPFKADTVQYPIESGKNVTIFLPTFISNLLSLKYIIVDNSCYDFYMFSYCNELMYTDQPKLSF